MKIKLIIAIFFIFSFQTENYAENYRSYELPSEKFLSPYPYLPRQYTPPYRGEYPWDNKYLKKQQYYDNYQDDESDKKLPVMTSDQFEAKIQKLTEEDRKKTKGNIC